MAMFDPRNLQVSFIAQNPGIDKFTRSKKSMRYLICAFVVLVFLSACGGGGGDGTPTDPGQEPTASAYLNNLQAIGRNGQVELSWDQVSGVTYNMYWSTSSGVTTSDFQAMNISSPYIHNGRSNGVTVFYIVEAIADGEREVSDEIWAMPNSIPAQPQNLQGESDDSKVTLSWESSIRATSYNLYWNNSGNVLLSDNVIEDVSSPFTHDNLTNDTAYYYIVTAVNGAGESVPATEISVIPERVPPLAPTNLMSFSGDNKIILTWEPSKKATTYNLYWTTSFNVGDVYDNQIANVTSPYEHTGLSVGPRYTYIVTAANSIGESGRSQYSFAYAGDLHVVYVSASAIDDTGDGLTPATAKQTIAAAIAIAVPPAEIRVNAGDYDSGPEDAARVVMVEGVSLYGGYSPDFSSRNPAQFVSAITDRGSNTGARPSAVEGGAGIYQFTVVDGFTLNNNDTLTISDALYLHSGNAATIQNNVINGGATRSAVHIGTAAPTLKNNVINARQSRAAIRTIDADGATIINNTINANDGNDAKYGIQNVRSINLKIGHNIIFGGSNSPFSHGITNIELDNTTVIYNNIIHGGNGDRSFGIHDDDAETIIRNNTVYGGNGSVFAYGMFLQQDLPTKKISIIENNMVFTRTGPRSHCMYSAYSVYVVLRNNNLFSCGSLYTDANTGCTDCTLEEINALGNGRSQASGNISLDPGFVDVDGADNDIDTLGDNNWRLGPASPAAVRNGGLNGTQLDWSFSADFAGNTRPPTGDWAIGAYQP